MVERSGSAAELRQQEPELELLPALVLGLGLLLEQERGSEPEQE